MLPQRPQRGTEEEGQERNLEEKDKERDVGGALSYDDLPANIIPFPTSTPIKEVVSATAKAKSTAKTAEVDLFAGVSAVKGIGPTSEKLLTMFLGLHTIHDLLYYFPFRHEDYSSFKRISDLMYGAQESVVCDVVDVHRISTKGGKQIIEVTFGDETGMIKAVYFHQSLVRGMVAGERLVVSGKVDQWAGKPAFKSPITEKADKELLNTGRLVPVYHTTERVSVYMLRKFIKTAVDTYAGYLPEHLPDDVRARNNLMPLADAVRQYHFPKDIVALNEARRRLAFDEFFMVQLGVLMKRRDWQESLPGEPIRTDPALLAEFQQTLPFDMTGAQKRAMYDILADIDKTKPMSRMVQGDVGSGKTVVAAAALLMAIGAGFQGALMAPTEILAEQHYRGLTKLFGDFATKPVAQQKGINPRIALLTGSVKKRDKEKIYADIAAGEIDLVIGTHAIIQQGVEFKRLGVSIIDEQHRFGVLQRAMLRQKAYNPHVLVMTATPIPRSLSLTIYGDLDLSIIDEMPPGRQPIKTRWVQAHERDKAYGFVGRQIAAGRQAFIICPLVEESDQIAAKAAVAEHARLQEEVYPDLRLGLLHGRMKPTEKDAIMRSFRDHELDILVSTSVIEVGIDVPNSTVMLIEGADRFGLSQLHQFRGRVGRGAHQSFCMLFESDQELSQEGRKRLAVIETTQSGFVLAEEDLKMRGPGEFFGTRQSGVPDLRVATANDMPLLELARTEAADLFAADPDLTHGTNGHLKSKVARLWNAKADVS